MTATWLRQEQSPDILPAGCRGGDDAGQHQQLGTKTTTKLPAVTLDILLVAAQAEHSSGCLHVPNLQLTYEEPHARRGSDSYLDRNCRL